MCVTIVKLARGCERPRKSRPRNARCVATFDAKVEIVEPAGSDTFVVTHVAGKELTARVRADRDVRVGENQVFAFDLDRADCRATI